MRHFENIEPYNYPIAFLKDAYRQLLFPRLIEEKMLLMLRHGRISKWFSGIGEEAISVGTVLGLNASDYIFTLHRNLGVFTARSVPLTRLFGQFQGRASGFTKGRDRSFHFGTQDYKIIGMISHLGPQLALATGVALAARNRAENEVVVAFTGEGGTSEGDFHEALNIAAVWKLPVIFIIVNNGYALSTPAHEQYACTNLLQRAEGYGMQGFAVDGNDILAVYEAISQSASALRRDPRPVLLECETFRMRGHEEASGTAYVPNELFAYWAERDPVKRFESSLLERNVITAAEVENIKASLQTEIDSAVEEAFSEPIVQVSLSTELGDVFAPVEQAATQSAGEAISMRFVDAISDALHCSMLALPELVLLGQDIADYGGVFKVTDGFLQEFGSARVRNTPLCESAVIGTAFGLALRNIPAMVEMQFSDFVSCGFNQIVNNLAKAHYRWGQSANVVIRMPSGAGVGAGPYHSQTTESWFFHCPGLKIVYPAFPVDAKGLLIRSFEDPNPVLFFEHKKLYRSVQGLVPEGYYSLDFGQARIIQDGCDVTIITYGLGVHWALEFAEKNTHISILIVDLRTLSPIDYDTIYEAVASTGRVLVLYEANFTGAVGAEIAARISQECFADLDAPVMRCGSLDTPIPFAAPLEEQYLATSRISVTIKALLDY